MMYIIRFQYGKTLAKIMHDASVSKYKKTEIIYRRIYFGTIVILWLLAIWLVLNNGPILNQLNNEVQNWIIQIRGVIFIVLLIGSYLTLTFYLKKFYQYDYQ
jgi:hypothetical protein